MLVYINGCDDLINMDKVLRIEFRNAHGSLTAQKNRVTHEADVQLARVYYDFPVDSILGHPPMTETYYGTSAQELFRKMRAFA